MKDNNCQMQQQTGKDIHWTMKVLNQVVESTASITDDAERIKAILLHRYHCSHFAFMNKHYISKEWESMEKKLYMNAFWTYINPNPNDQRYANNRMNFVIEMLLRLETDETGNFLDVSTLLQQTPHYLFERCLPILLDTKTDRVPFLKCDYSLKELIENEFACPVAFHEITPGMMALWIAVKLIFERLWSKFIVLVMDYAIDCREVDINGMRDFISHCITAKEDDLVSTGKTLGEYLEEEGEG